MKGEKPEEMKGKYKETMNQMFDSKAASSENFHANLIHSLEDNKRKYDRQLYSDWLIKVYARCTNICMKPSVINDEINPDGKQSLLKESERQCARNCMRKFDLTYKTFDQVEKKIFDDYIEDHNIDPADFVKALQQEEEDKQAEDIAEGQKLEQQGKI